MSILKIGMYASSRIGAIPNQNYLTFSSDAPFSIKFNQISWDGVLEYSVDTENWYEWDASEISSVGNVLYLRGSGNSYITGMDALEAEDVDDYAIQITATSGVECAGNIMSLLDHVDVDNAVMAAGAFAAMFCLCTSLTTAPELPATTLADYCYSAMFLNCTSLTTAPELPATTLADSCYSDMFSDCTSLTSAPELPATTLADSCYFAMFLNCTSLTSAPELPATTLADYCYSDMFYLCTSIKISSTQTGIYQTPWRIPTAGTGATATNWSLYMLVGTSGTFTGNPTINTTYYQAN